MTTEQAKGTELATIPDEEKPKAMTLADMMMLAQEAVDSSMFPGLSKRAQALVKIMAGRELGLGPMASLRLIDVVQGKVRLSAEATAGLIKRSARYDYRVVEHTDQCAVLEFTDRGKIVYTSKFTMDDAKRAFLDKPDSGWRKFPRAMLFARAVTQGARIVCPEILAGAEIWEAQGYDVVEGRVVREGEPPTEAWKAFWAQATELGYTEDQVHQLLGIISVKDWIAQGKTLDDALAELRRVRISQNAQHTGAAPETSLQTPQAPPSAQPQSDVAPMPKTGPSTVPQGAAPKPENMGQVMEWARGQGKVTGDVIGVLEKAGYWASDRTPLRSIIQVMDAWHEDETKRNPTPATVKALCMAAWGLKG